MTLEERIARLEAEADMKGTGPHGPTGPLWSGGSNLTPVVDVRFCLPKWKKPPVLIEVCL